MTFSVPYRNQKVCWLSYSSPYLRCCSTYWHTKVDHYTDQGCKRRSCISYHLHAKLLAFRSRTLETLIYHTKYDLIDADFFKWNARNFLKNKWNVQFKIFKLEEKNSRDATFVLNSTRSFTLFCCLHPLSLLVHRMFPIRASASFVNRAPDRNATPRLPGFNLNRRWHLNCSYIL